MLFSILVPVFNVEKYLSQCIESILNQTEQDFELILVDDGSNDSSGQVCDSYQKLYPVRIRVIHQENKGLLLARRAAIKEAKGDYCVFVDSDDYLRLDALEIIKQIIDETKSDLILYNCIDFTDKGKQRERNPVFAGKQIFCEENKYKIYEKIIEGNSLNNLFLKVVKKDLLDKDTDYSRVAFVSNGEDLLQTLPIVTNAKKIVYIDTPLYFYRQNVSSMTRTFNPKWFESVSFVFKQLANYTKKWNMYDEEKLKRRYIQIIIQAIKQMGYPSCNIRSIILKNYLEVLAHDEYFIEAYDHVKLRNINLTWRIMLRLLRQRNILLIQLITAIRRFITRIKRIKLN